jgi:TPR repeat protein
MLLDSGGLLPRSRMSSRSVVLALVAVAACSRTLSSSAPASGDLDEAPYQSAYGAEVEPVGSADAGDGSEPVIPSVCKTDASGSGFDCTGTAIADCASRCESGEIESCTGMVTAVQRGQSVDGPAVGRSIGVLCDQGSALACRGAGLLAFGGDGQPPNAARAAGFWERACRGGDQVGCTYLGYLLKVGEGIRKDVARGLELTRQSCAACSAVGCNGLGYFYAKGDGVAADGKLARRLFFAACEAGYLNACDSVGEAYERGWGGSIDLEKAFRYYKMSCDYWNGGDTCTNMYRAQEALGRQR